MRITALLLVLFLLPLAGAQNEGMAFADDHQVRIAFGDIPSTNDTLETPFQWNFRETRVVPTAEDLLVEMVPGREGYDIDCDCDFAVGEEGRNLRVHFLDNSTPEQTLTITYFAQGTAIDGFYFSSTGDEALFLIYAPELTTITANKQNELPPNFYYPREAGSVSPPLIIHQYHSDGPFWFTLTPTGDTVAVAPSGSDMSWAWLLVGLLVGAGAWYGLVRFGYVQKRQRKQIAGEAVHKTAAKAEDKATLEGRKRVLMAALKELEVAKMNKEIATEAYDALKADFKRQTVTVMRAIEESN